MKLGEALINGLVHPNALHSNQTVRFSKSSLDSAVVILFRRMFHRIFHQKFISSAYFHISINRFFFLLLQWQRKSSPNAYLISVSTLINAQFILALFLLIARI